MHGFLLQIRVDIRVAWHLSIGEMHRRGGVALANDNVYYEASSMTGKEAFTVSMGRTAL